MRVWPLITLMLTVLLPLGAQDVQVLTATYTRNFERAEDPDTRVAAVRDAVASKVSGMGAFYQKVLQYLLQTPADIATDGRSREMAGLVLEKIAEEKVRDARATVWSLFKATPEPTTRVAAAKALAATAGGDRQLVAGMAEFLAAQNAMAASATKPDTQVVMALVKALGAIRDPGSFKAVFGAHSVGYYAELTAAAEAALLATDGDLQELLGGIVRSGAAAERRDAFALALKSQRIDQRGKAALAEEALKAALAMSAPAQESRQIGRDLRASAMAVLESARWSRATGLAVEHFSTAALEYDRGQVTLTYLVAAANGLGAMGTHEAAERLTDYLGLLNSYRESGKAYDEQIVLAVINNTRKLGDKVAFANLSYAQYLNYSDRVKQAAKDAISSLKW